MLGDTTLPSVPRLDRQAIDEIGDVVEASAGTGSDAASGDCDGQMGFAGAGATDQNGIALLGNKPATGEIIDEGLVDGRTLELEVLKVLGERQLGNGELILDRAGLLLVDFGVESMANDTPGLVRALD